MPKSAQNGPASSTSSSSASSSSASSSSASLHREVAWNNAAWRKSGFNFSGDAVALKAAELGRGTQAVLGGPLTSPTTKKAFAARAQASAKDKQKPTKLSVKTKRANQVQKGKGVTKMMKVSAQPTDVLTERQNLDAQLSRRAQRRIVSNPYVAGPCYFEALSLSNSFTTGLGDKAGANLIRDVMGKAYLDPTLQENLKKWVQQSERVLAPSFSSHVAAAADAAALSAGQDVASQWQPTFFYERSQMMISTNCDIPTRDLWKYNIGSISTNCDSHPYSWGMRI